LTLWQVMWKLESSFVHPKLTSIDIVTGPSLIIDRTEYTIKLDLTAMTNPDNIEQIFDNDKYRWNSN